MRVIKIDIEQLEKYVNSLRPHFKDPPSFEQFAEAWATWDEQSKRIIKTGAEDPGDDVHLIAIREYLRRMGEL